jgi:uncharacterized protein (TIGR00251 family)
MLLKVKVRPSSSKDEILAFKEPDSLEISLRAKPENNEANRALCQFLAKFFGKRVEAIKILQGRTSQKKVLSVEGLTETELKERFSR